MSGPIRGESRTPAVGVECGCSSPAYRALVRLRTGVAYYTALDTTRQRFARGVGGAATRAVQLLYASSAEYMRAAGGPVYV